MLISERHFEFILRLRHFTHSHIRHTPKSTRLVADQSTPRQFRQQTTAHHHHHHYFVSGCPKDKDCDDLSRNGDCDVKMTLLHSWLSHNSLRQAFNAFDMDNPGDMPTRPILQVLKIGSSSVTMAQKKVATLKYPPSHHPNSFFQRD